MLRKGRSSGGHKKSPYLLLHKMFFHSGKDRIVQLMGAIDFLHNLRFSITVNVQLMPQCVPVLPPSQSTMADSLSFVNFVGRLVEPGVNPEKFSDCRFPFIHQMLFSLENKSQKKEMIGRRNQDSRRKGDGAG